MNDAAVVVFARLPVPGHGKTRLIPTLGAAGAAALQRALLDRTLDEVERLAGVTRHLHYAGPATDSLPDPGLCRPGWRMAAQTGDDLGSRMFNALQAALATHARVLLIGSDIIDFTAGDLRAALADLGAGPALMLAPAADGGYWMIGARNSVPRALFDGIQWGGGEVYADTLKRCSALGLACRRGPLRHDIDCPADLDRHQALLCGFNLPAGPGGAPAAPARAP